MSFDFVAGSRNTVAGGGKKLGENKLLAAKSSRYNPYTTKFSKCKVCKSTIHQTGSTYCQGCAYKLGICSMCGIKILETKNYRQSSV